LDYIQIQIVLSENLLGLTVFPCH